MSRSGYIDEYELESKWQMICCMGAVNSAIKGKRGQTALIDMRAAMDAMQKKELVADALEISGQYCALGVLGHSRGVDMSDIDPDDPDEVAEKLNIAPAMAREVAFQNDECGLCSETPAQRWWRMRNWVDRNIKA